MCGKQKSDVRGTKSHGWGGRLQLRPHLLPVFSPSSVPRHLTPVTWYLPLRLAVIPVLCYVF
jgi:hypothetical protein